VNFLTALLGPSETKSVSVDDLWERVAGGAQSKAGIPVNWQSALRVSVAFSCARVLAEGIAQIPEDKMLPIAAIARGTAYTISPNNSPPMNASRKAK